MWNILVTFCNYLKGYIENKDYLLWIIGLPSVDPLCKGSSNVMQCRCNIDIPFMTRTKGVYRLALIFINVFVTKELVYEHLMMMMMNALSTTLFIEYDLKMITIYIQFFFLQIFAGVCFQLYVTFHNMQNQRS